jgi:thioester reductase-like protein
MSASDIQNLTAEVSIVFHSAATVRFDDPLKFSIQMNVVSVDRLIDLCHKMAKIEALIHISTAYSNCDRTSIEEVVYPSPINPQEIISAIE